MDLRQYFRRLREIESKISEEFPVVISLDTADGGKAGVVAEVSRAIAAQLLAEGRAVLADEPQKEEFAARQLAARKAGEKDELMKRIHVSLISDSEADTRLNGPKRSGK
jgi:hypothetical protein